MPEIVGMGDVGNALPVIFFFQDDQKVVTFKFMEGETPEKKKLEKGQWARYFPGEEDLAGRETNEKLRSGVLETFIWDVGSESEAILSFSTETAIASISRAITKAGHNAEKPDEWQDLTYSIQRKGMQSWKVTIKDTSEVEGVIKECVGKYEGETFESMEELALKIGVENDLDDFEEIKEILTRMKGKEFSLGKGGLKLKKGK